MAYGSITETEAWQRGLTDRASCVTGSDGVTRYYHEATRLCWVATRDLVVTVTPPWSAGLPA